jgi:hypothetical protein
MELRCTLAQAAGHNEVYKVKKVCSIGEMPHNAKYTATIFTPNRASRDIYRTPSGVCYATPERF